MIDAKTRMPLRVRNEGTAGPYLWVTVDQLDDVRRILGENHIRYSVEENVISINGSPEMAVVNLGREGDAAATQAVLDGIH